jgi:hypothetical protein
MESMGTSFRLVSPVVINVTTHVNVPVNGTGCTEQMVSSADKRNMRGKLIATRQSSMQLSIENN